MKNEGKARARALGRLDPIKHEQHLEAERTRKKDAALRAARGEQVVRRMPVSRKHARTEDAVVVRADLPSPAWKEKARERVAAELQRRAACEARVKEARNRWFQEMIERETKKYGHDYGSFIRRLAAAQWDE